MQSLDPRTLVGYTEDPKAKVLFEKRAQIPAILGFLLFGGPLVWMIATEERSVLCFSSLAVGAVFLISSVLILRFSTPTSKTHRPMKRFWVENSQANGNEIIYVCDDSKTFFRRVFAKQSRRSF